MDDFLTSAHSDELASEYEERQAAQRQLNEDREFEKESRIFRNAIQKLRRYIFPDLAEQRTFLF